MKRIATVVGLMLFIFSPGTCLADKYDDALAEIRAEDAVLSAAWGAVSKCSLYVGVRDTGSRRDGYAEYICLILLEHGIKDVVIHVMDEAAAYRGGFTELGKHYCR